MPNGYKHISCYYSALVLYFQLPVNEDKLNLDQEIYGLGGNDEQKNELDKWLYENYTQAYNIEVKYKWNSYELNTTAQLVPIMERFVKTFYGYDSTSVV